MNKVFNESFKQEIKKRVELETWLNLKAFFPSRGTGGRISLGMIFQNGDDEFTILIQPTSDTHFSLVDEDWNLHTIFGTYLRAMHKNSLLENLIKLIKRLCGEL